MSVIMLFHQLSQSRFLIDVHYVQYLSLLELNNLVLLIVTLTMVISIVCSSMKYILKSLNTEQLQVALIFLLAYENTVASTL